MSGEYYMLLPPSFIKMPHNYVTVKIVYRRWRRKAAEMPVKVHLMRAHLQV